MRFGVDPSPQRMVSPGRFGKLKLRADGPFGILKKAGEDVYKVEHYGSSETVSVSDLSPSTEEDKKFDLRTSFFQLGKIVENSGILEVQ